MPVALTIVRLSTTPIKGLSLHHPRSIRLTKQGVDGDRQFYLVDDKGKIQSCTANPDLYPLAARYDPETHRLEVIRGNDVLCAGIVETAAPVDTDMWGLRTITSDVVADPRWSTCFSNILKKRVSLVRARGSAYDVHPASILGTSSLDELARRAGLAAVDPRRFRMLLEFSGGEPHVEDSWVGKLLRVGSAVLRVAGPATRCAAITRNPGSGAVDLQTLRLITSYRGRHDSGLGVAATFGVYCDVIEPGTISRGDCMRVVP
jgi:uncharacterized protein